MRVLVLLAVATLASAGGFPLANTHQCNDVGTWSSTCDVSNTGTTVDITGGSSNPGSNSSSYESGSPPRQGDTTPSTPSPEECGPLGCRGNYSVVMIPDVTLADLASFRPATPELTGQPTGFAVAGMPANLVAAASVQEIPGTILDWDVTVRFTPVAFEFDHGDGTTAVHPTGGASWERLGQAQLTPTATSHVYRERGRYSVGVTVRYAAAVDFGTGWRPVPGHVTATSGGYGVQVLEARTALVARTCVENPRGPGC